VQTQIPENDIITLLENFGLSTSNSKDNELIEQIIKLLKNKDLPKVPKFTSVGASGDLIPLSHIFLKIIENYKPKAKESLSFINGTSYSLANFIIGLFSIKEVLNFSNFVLILSAKANKVNFEHFTLSLKKTKKNKYFSKVLQDLNKIISVLDLKVNNPMLQAPYCYRCYPQIVESLYGVFDLAYLFAKSELNSSTDNPLLINNKFISAGNFHGNTISAFSDHLKTHVFQLANLSFQRMNHLLHPKFLTLNEGLNSGFMISQYLASHLLAELKIISQKLSVENFPVSLNQEDFVSYSENNSKLLLKSIYICSLILSIELLLALQKIKLYENLNLAKLRKYLKKFLIKTDVLDILPIKSDEEFRKFSSIEGLQNKIFLNHKLIRFLENLVEDL
ncbi:MAG: aromatic amino acid lyase, partial [bacterium]